MKHRTLAILVVLCASGCATILGNTSKNVTFTSEPRGAKVSIESQKVGIYYNTTTPGTIRLSKKKSYVATYQLDGYHTVTVPVDRSVGKNAAGSGGGNLLLLGIFAPIGMGIDAASGAAANLPDAVHTDLVPVTDPAPGNAGDITHWREMGAKEAEKRREQRLRAQAEAKR